MQFVGIWGSKLYISNNNNNNNSNKSKNKNKNNRSVLAFMFALYLRLTQTRIEVLQFAPMVLLSTLNDIANNKCLKVAICTKKRMFIACLLFMVVLMCPGRY